jgi:hypothetical protein
VDDWLRIFFLSALWSATHNPQAKQHGHNAKEPPNIAFTTSTSVII